MEVYYEKSDYYNGVGNYVIFVGNSVFALTMNEYNKDNIAVKVGELTQNRRFVLIENNLHSVNDIVAGMKKLEDRQIPNIIKQRFNLWTH